MLEVYECAVPVLNTSQSLSHSMSAKDVIWACVISDNKLFELKMLSEPVSLVIISYLY